METTKRVIINIDKLTVKYQSFVALRDVAFRLYAEDFVAIIGANGSGKTTLIKAMLDLVPIAAGKVDKDKHIHVGYLPQHTSMQDRFFPATVDEVVSTGLLARKTFPKLLTRDDRHRVGRTLDYLDIRDLRKKRIGALSGGQLQRVLLARALVSDPDMLILDEPTSALDQSMREQFFEILRKLNGDGVTVVLVTHDIASAGDYVNRVIYLDQTLLFDGSFGAFCETEAISPFVHTHKLRHAKQGGDA